MNFYIKCWKHCADFSSRASRTEFWSFYVVNLVITALLSLLAYWVFYDFPIVSKITLCYSLAVLLPGVAVAVRRLHDVGRSGWLFVLILIPLIGLVALVFLMCLKGQKEENDWGASLNADKSEE